MKGGRLRIDIDTSYDANKIYKVVLNKIANVAGDISSCYYMVNEKQAFFSKLIQMEVICM